MVGLYLLLDRPSSRRIALHDPAVTLTYSDSYYGRLCTSDGTGSGFLTRDPTRPDPGVECFETIPGQRIAVSVTC